MLSLLHLQIQFCFPDCIFKVAENFWQRQGTHLVVQPLEMKNHEGVLKRKFHYLVVKENVVVKVLIAKTSH